MLYEISHLSINFKRINQYPQTIDRIALKTVFVWNIPVEIVIIVSPTGLNLDIMKMVYGFTLKLLMPCVFTALVIHANEYGYGQGWPRGYTGRGESAWKRGIRGEHVALTLEIPWFISKSRQFENIIAVAKTFRNYYHYRMALQKKPL